MPGLKNIICFASLPHDTFRLCTSIAGPLQAKADSSLWSWYKIYLQSLLEPMGYEL